jgi:hypothetical protein
MILRWSSLALPTSKSGVSREVIRVGLSVFMVELGLVLFRLWFKMFWSDQVSVVE